MDTFALTIPNTHTHTYKEMSVQIHMLYLPRFTYTKFTSRYMYKVVSHIFACYRIYDTSWSSFFSSRMVMVVVYPRIELNRYRADTCQHQFPHSLTQCIHKMASENRKVTFSFVRLLYAFSEIIAEI